MQDSGYPVLVDSAPIGSILQLKAAINPNSGEINRHKI